MRKLFKERKLFKGGNYMRKYGICYFKGGLRLFMGLYILFLPNVPGATFIQGGMFILDSRVYDKTNTLHQFFYSKESDRKM